MIKKVKLVSFMAATLLLVACSDTPTVAIPEDADLLASCINPGHLALFPKETQEATKSVCTCVNTSVEQIPSAKFKKAYNDARTSNQGSLESMLAPVFQSLDPKSDEYKAEAQNLIDLTSHAKVCRADELAKKKG
jgi:hypothetical protein